MCLSKHAGACYQVLTMKIFYVPNKSYSKKRPVNPVIITLLKILDLGRFQYEVETIYHKNKTNWSSDPTLQL